MKLTELLLEQKSTNDDFMKIIKDFLPLAMKELKIDTLPKIKLELYIHDEEQPTFGRFSPDDNIIHLGIENRHPLDIIRTLAHELVHFKQGSEHRLGPTSGHTGSPEENQAHELAGIIMRNFNKAHPAYFKEPAIHIAEGKYSGPMEPLTASGKEKSGAVAALERALIRAKENGTEMNYENIDAMMQKICKAHNITGQKLHDDFVKANRLIPDNWIKKQVEESAAWQKSSGKNKNGGLNKKGVASYRREHPGSHLQTAVTTKPSKLKKGSKASKRRKSFCARMKGMKKSRTSAKTAHDPNSRINKSLRKWHCESIEEMQELIMLGEQYISNLKESRYRHGFADPNAPRLRGRGREDDEYHTPDPVEPQYNIKVNGEVINRQPFANRAEALAWAKQAVAAGKLDPKNAKLSPIQGVAEGSNAGDIELSHSMSPDMLYVHATSDGTDVGGARFKKIDGAWTGDIVHVYPQFRRQGIATKIYDYAEDLVGKIIPSKTLKPKGKKFWDNRDNQGVAEGITPATIHKLADKKNIKWDDEPSFLQLTKRLTGKEHLDDLDQSELAKVKDHLENLDENFADGKNPGRKGLAKRSGVNTKASVSSLRSTAKHSSGEKARMAHWLANMKAGKAKANKK